MDGDFLILKVTSSVAKVTAVLPLTQILGQDMNMALRKDFQQLSESDTQLVELDLRSVAYIDGNFLTRLLELQKALTARSVSLLIAVSPSLREVMRVTRLDQVFTVVEGEFPDAN